MSLGPHAGAVGLELGWNLGRADLQSAGARRGGRTDALGNQELVSGNAERGVMVESSWD
jgi:hypothetical protein